PRVRGEPPRIDAKDLVTGCELGDGRAGCFALASHLGAEDIPPRPGETADEPADERLALTNPSVGPIDRRGADLDQDLVFLGHRPLDLGEPQDLRRPIPVEDNCSHQLPVPSPVGIAKLQPALHRKLPDQPPGLYSLIPSFIHVRMPTPIRAVAARHAARPPYRQKRLALAGCAAWRRDVTAADS